MTTIAINYPPLDARELEALRWAMDGKTTISVGAAMGISTTHAELKLHKAQHKLHCRTKYEAVIKAIRLGLLTCG